MTVKSVMTASAGQRVVTGGHHHLQADITLVDARSYPAEISQALGGQGAWALLDAALLPDPMDRVVENFAESCSNWLRNPDGPGGSGS